MASNNQSVKGSNVNYDLFKLLLQDFEEDDPGPLFPSADVTIKESKPKEFEEKEEVKMKKNVEIPAKVDNMLVTKKKSKKKKKRPSILYSEFVELYGSMNKRVTYFWDGNIFGPFGNLLKEVLHEISYFEDEMKYGELYKELKKEIEIIIKSKKKDREMLVTFQENVETVQKKMIRAQLGDISKDYNILIDLISKLTLHCSFCFFVKSFYGEFY